MEAGSPGEQGPADHGHVDPVTGRRIVRLNIEELASLFLPVLRQGLPVNPETAGEYLPYFAIVLNYAKGTDHLSRVIALDRVVTLILKEWPKTPEGNALRLLFAFEPAWRSWTFTRRQAEAAQAMDRSPDRMRKQIQRRLLLSFAYEFTRRNDRYKPAPMRRVFLEDVPDAGRRPESGDDIEWVERQARCVSELYAVRADLLAARRLAGVSETAMTEHLDSGLRHYVTMQRLIRDAVQRYGIGVRLGEENFAVSNIETLLGGEGPFTEDELFQLVTASLTHPELGAPDKLRAKWRDWILAL